MSFCSIHDQNISTAVFSAHQRVRASSEPKTIEIDDASEEK
jgi:hypothetical protein